MTFLEPSLETINLSGKNSFIQLPSCQSSWFHMQNVCLSSENSLDSQEKNIWDRGLRNVRLWNTSLALIGWEITSCLLYLSMNFLLDHWHLEEEKIRCFLVSIKEKSTQNKIFTSFTPSFVVLQLWSIWMEWYTQQQVPWAKSLSLWGAPGKMKGALFLF